MRRLAPVVAALLFLFAAAGAHAAPWRILKDHWSEADEQGFSDFVKAIGATNCSSSESCLRNAANPYRDTDENFVDIDVDCAKLPYLLRAYYAWKNGLPFSYVDAVGGSGGDLRFTEHANRAVSRHDIIDHGGGINGAATIRAMLGSVFSGTYRTDAAEEGRIASDFYAPALQPGSIRPGTVVYDINGHVGLIYKVDSHGRAYYMEAHPDFTISRSVYGAQFGQSSVHLGGGLKNWRPLRLEGARQTGDGALIGGHIVFAQNADIPDFSLVQYVGTEPNPDQDVRQARFFYNDNELGFYEYVRVAVSGGRMDYNPVYEVKATMRTLCNDLKDRAQFVTLAFTDGIAGKPHPSRLPANIYSSDSPEWESYATPARDARLRVAFAQFYADLSDMIELYRQRDPRIAYDGYNLKADLEKAYAQRAAACTITYLNSGKQPVTITFEDMTSRLFRLSFDPYQCIELRWGADGAERETCHDGRDRLRWYDEEQPLRNEMDRNDGSPHSGSDMVPPVDIKSLIDNIGARTPYTGMSAVGR